MNNEPVFLGVDLGTSSVKAQLVAGDGQVVSTSRVEYGHFDNGVQFDQDPEEIWRALVEAVRLLGRKTPLSTVAAMGVVGHAPSMVWVDHSGVPLTRVMGWRDVRSSSHVEKVAQLMGEAWQLENLGYILPVSAGFTPTRLSWFAATYPEVVEASRVVLSLKDFAVFRLTGEIVSDPINGRGICHAISKHPADELITALGIDPVKIPRVQDPWNTAGTLRPSVAQQLGLPAKITVAVGWGDLFSSMLSIRALSSADREFDITGTAEAGGASTRGAVPAPGLLSIPVRSQLNVTYGSTQAGGGSVDWLQKRILVGIDDAWINREVGQLRRVTAPSLLFLPHLGGERAPLWDRTIRGAFLGMDTTHDRADLARAVLEGVAYSIRQILMRVADARGYRLDTPVLIAGAASRNTTWNQIKADVLGRPVEVIPLAEPSAFGAAILGFVAAGHATDPFDVAERISKPGHVLDPDPRFRDHYDDLFALYDGSQANLASIHLGLEKVRGKGDSKRGQVEGN